VDSLEQQYCLQLPGRHRAMFPSRLLPAQLATVLEQEGTSDPAANTPEINQSSKLTAPGLINWLFV
jgi:hypothetical protein